MTEKKARAGAEGGEMPIFTKLHELLQWLGAASSHFPRAQRHALSSRLLGAAFGLLETLVAANGKRDAERLRLLQEADIGLAMVRHYLLVAFRWRWLSAGQYEHASRLTAEIGRLLGGWQKVTR